MEEKKKQLKYPKTAKVLTQTAKGTAAMTKAMGKAQKENADKVFSKEKGRTVKRVKRAKMKRFGSKF
jgi:hypothetical protein